MAGNKRGKIEGKSVYKQIGFPYNLYVQLENEASRRHISVPELVRHIVEKHYDENVSLDYILRNVPFDSLLEEIKRRNNDKLGQDKREA